MGVVYIFATFLTCALNIVNIAILQQLLNLASSGTTDNIKKLIIIGVILCVIWAIMGFLETYIRDLYKNKCFYLLRTTYINNLLSSKYSDITNLDSATHISALTNNIEILNQNYFLPILSIFSDIFLIVLSFFAVLLISPLVTLIMCGLTLLMAIMPLILKKPLDNANFEYSSSLKKFTEKLKETLLGIEVIKTNNAENSFDTQNEENSRGILKKQNKVARITDTIAISSSLVNNVLIIVLVGIVSIFVSNGNLEIGTTIAVMSLAMRFLGGWMTLVSEIVAAGSTRSIRKSIEPYLQNINAISKSMKKEFSNTISLSNVSFKYNSDSEKTALKNINLTFEKNKKYLILGKSGSGKSTLLKLICKLEEDYKGEIKMDEMDYSDISPANINEIISMAQQKCYLFNTSLKNNIDLNYTKNKDRLEYSIKTAQLTDFINQQAEGLETVVDEEVNQVSGGEKLRINLARALYRDTPIILLDEITSAVDKTTSKKIENAILQINDKTIINVCHKYDETTLDKYDCIILMDNGSVAAYGKYDDLESNPIFLDFQVIDDSENE